MAVVGLPCALSWLSVFCCCVLPIRSRQSPERENSLSRAAAAAVGAAGPHAGGVSQSRVTNRLSGYTIGFWLCGSVHPDDAAIHTVVLRARLARFTHLAHCGPSLLLWTLILVVPFWLRHTPLAAPCCIPRVRLQTYDSSLLCSPTLLTLWELRRISCHGGLSHRGDQRPARGVLDSCADGSSPTMQSPHTMQGCRPGQGGPW